MPDTMRLVPTSAKTAIHMVAYPVKARTKNTALTAKAKEMFSITMVMVARESRMKRGTFLRSP